MLAKAANSIVGNRVNFGIVNVSICFLAFLAMNFWRYLDLFGACHLFVGDHLFEHPPCHDRRGICFEEHRIEAV